MGGNPDPDPVDPNPADPPPPDKGPPGDKTIMRDVAQRVEELLGVLGTMTGVRRSLQVAVTPEALDTFLQMNHEEGFDLEALNSIDMHEVGRAARGSKELLRQVIEKVDQLMPRLRSETEDSSLVGPVLRDKTLDWCRRSPTEPDWATTMVPRWGGIFHESRIPGGRLSPKLSTRLETLLMECETANGWAVAIHRIQAGTGALLARIPGVRSLIKSSKRPLRPLTWQVAQAYLDDLAASVRSPDRSSPMERLSRVARKIGTAEMNITLGILFPQSGGEPFLVVDPRLHPDIDGVRIRPPTDKAAGDAITYELTSPTAPAPPGTDAGGDMTIDASLTSPWDREDLTIDEWRGVLETLTKQKARLDPPPVGDYRQRSSYLGLRDLLLEDPSARTGFLSARWKGKPTGLVLVHQLLCDGTFAPEEDTDGDYLEAELTHIEKGDPDQRPADGRWTLPQGWTVVRELGSDNSLTYRADQGTTAPPPSAPDLVAPDQDPG